MTCREKTRKRLTGVESRYRHLLGASWEGFALEQVIYKLRATPEEAYFWGVHGAGELDLLIVKDGKRIGFEIKHTSSPKLTHSIKLAIDELNLEQVFVIFNGETS